MTDSLRYQRLREGTIGQRLRFLLGDSAFYGGSSIVSRLFSLLTVPVLARIFSTSQYGVIDLIAVIGNVFMAFVTMGQDSAAARYYYDTEDSEERRKVVTQGLVIEFVLAVAVCLVLFQGAGPLLERLTGSREHAGVFRILVAGIPFIILLNYTRNLLKWTFARRQYIVLEVGASALIVFLTLLFVLGLDMGIAGVFYAQLFANGALSLLGVWYCRRLFVASFSMEYAGRMAHFGWPFMVLAVGGTLIPALDRGFITRFLDLEAMGYYAIGYKYAFLIMLPIVAFQTAWGPFSLSLYKEEDAEQTYSRVLTHFTVGACLVCYLLVAARTPAIMLLASKRYLPGTVVVLPLVFAFTIQSAAWITGIGISLSKKTYYSLLSYTVGLAVTALALWLLVVPYGIAGAAAAVLAGQVAQGTVYTLLAYRLYPLRFALRSPVAVLSLTIGLCLLAEFVAFENLAAQVLFLLLLFAVLTAAVWQKVFLPEERRALLAFLPARKN